MKILLVLALILTLTVVTLNQEDDVVYEEEMIEIDEPIPLNAA